MTTPAPNRVAIPTSQSPEPTTTRKRFVALKCCECDASIGVCLPESVSTLVLCPDCAPSDTALHRNLTPAEQTAIRADEAQREAQRQHMAAANASFTAISAKIADLQRLVGEHQ